MLCSRFRAGAFVAGALAAGLAASVLAVVPASAVVRATPQITGTCPTFLANATLYTHNNGGFTPEGTAHKGDVWATDDIPPIDGFSEGIDRTQGGLSWIGASAELGAPFVTCKLP